MSFLKNRQSDLILVKYCPVCVNLWVKTVFKQYLQEKQENVSLKDSTFACRT